VAQSLSWNEIRKQSTMKVTQKIFEKEYMTPNFNQNASLLMVWIGRIIIIQLLTFSYARLEGIGGNGGSAPLVFNNQSKSRYPLQVSPLPINNYKI
jgi:hypothetical protein